MDEVTVKREELLDAVKKNRETHRRTFEQAQKGYRTKVIELLDQALKDAREGGQIRKAFQLPTPEDHTADYDRVIRMLEMSVDEEVTIDAGDFSQFVMDDWTWKRQFIQSTAAYLAV